MINYARHSRFLHAAYMHESLCAICRSNSQSLPKAGFLENCLPPHLHTTSITTCTYQNYILLYTTKHSTCTCGGYPLQLALVVFFLVPLAHTALALCDDGGGGGVDVYIVESYYSDHDATCVSLLS